MLPLASQRDAQAQCPSSTWQICRLGRGQALCARPRSTPNSLKPQCPSSTGQPTQTSMSQFKANLQVRKGKRFARAPAQLPTHSNLNAPVQLAKPTQTSMSHFKLSNLQVRKGASAAARAPAQLPTHSNLNAPVQPWRILPTHSSLNIPVPLGQFAVRKGASAFSTRPRSTPN